MSGDKTTASSAPAAVGGATALQFQPFASAVDIPFWSLLGKKKLDTLKLSEAAIPLIGSFTCSTHAAVSGQLAISVDAFDVKQPVLANRAVGVSGRLHNSNTMESFKAFDKTKLLADLSTEMWGDITSGRALQNPELLVRFIALSYADLKAHTYLYWFCFPAFVLPECNITSAMTPLVASANGGWTAAELNGVARVVNASAFDAKTANAATATSATQPPPAPYFIAVIKSQTGGGRTVTAYPLSAYAEQKKAAAPGDEIVLGFLDACALPTHPGWTLRNLLTLAAVQWGLTSTRVICWRDLDQIAATATSSKSYILSVKFSLTAATSTHQTATISVTPMPRAVGWESNRNGKPGPRAVDLRSLMDDRVLAETSVDLNLKLMRWRALPSLDLPLISKTRALLLGAGTLGCAIARTLLAWGVRTITLVDSGNVSYSNPVRQSLFTHEDCVGGGKPKAATAAAALKRIFPGVEATGVKMMIPMPGHSVVPGSPEAKAVETDYNTLVALIKSHDVVFLGTDSRESRWLPTLICAATHTCCINTALGFDTFVVMRHGDNQPEPTATTAGTATAADVKSAPAPAPAAATNAAAGATAPVASKPARILGCYFCNDVVGPGDSMSDRTLDQQCTVTRPGLAPLSSALAVEMFIALLHHPQKHRASADDDGTAAPSAFGVVPHQLRGFLGQFGMQIVCGQQFEKCTACSRTMTNEYLKRGFGLILDALNQPSSFLEDISGLTALKKATEASTAALGWDKDGDSASDGDDF